MPLFCIMSTLIGGFMVGFGGYGLFKVLSENPDEQTAIYGIGFMVLMGLILLIAGICLTVKNYSPRQKVADKEESTFKMVTKAGTRDIKDANELISAVNSLVSGEEVMVYISPVCGGIKEWKFKRIKNQYLSFPTVEKKGKIKEYFTMPTSNINDATAMFVELMRDGRSVDFGKLIDIKRYSAVLEVYKLK